MAQLVAHLHGMEGVRSSNLLSSTETAYSQDSPAKCGVLGSSRLFGRPIGNDGSSGVCGCEETGDPE